MNKQHELLPIRRIVTGHDANGRAIVVSDGPLPTVVELPSVPGTVFHEVWATAGAPATVDNGPDPTLGALNLRPPAAGTRIRFVDIPPDRELAAGEARERAQQAFAALGDKRAGTANERSPHPLMHRTETVDYGIVIDGEPILVLDDTEVQLAPGCVVIQRGTNHAWANRSGRTCRMLFVLIDGRYDPAVAARLR